MYHYGNQTNISFYLQKIYNGADDAECQIRMRARWNREILQFNCGYTISSSKWSSANSRCKKNSFNKKGFSSSDINKELNRLEELANDIFKSFEVLEAMPGKKDYKNAFNLQNGKVSGVENQELTFDKCFSEFVATQSSMNSWAYRTLYAFNTLKKHMKNFNEALSMNEMNSSVYIKFLEYLINNEKLRNTTILKSWKLLKWFLKWADKNGYLGNKDYMDFNPHLKDVRDKEIVFLTWDELMAVYNLGLVDKK